VTSLNLHCNRIPRIEALTSGRRLRHLDLSSNRISRIEGLACLTSLRTINLSCNFITKVEGEYFISSLYAKTERGREIMSEVGCSPSPYSSLSEWRLACQCFMSHGVTVPLMSSSCSAPGLDGLVNLTRLNLSYNKINSLTGKWKMNEPGSHYILYPCGVK